MEFAKLIQEVNEDKKLVPDYTRSEKGKNFRALSEATIIEAINPVLKKYGVYYTTEILEYHLDVKEAWGSKGRKLQFIATMKVRLVFKDNATPHVLEVTEAVGMGIDDNDKAMGKAYTYAVKSALFKFFRLQYGDDPDAEASEPLYLEKPKENATENAKNEKKEENNVQKTKKSATKKAQLMTENQRDYIIGLMEQKQVSSKEVMAHFDGLDPTLDDNIPMTTARAMIKWLNDYDLPF